jgi:hypothetical protein
VRHIGLRLLSERLRRHCMARKDAGCGVDEHEQASEMLVQICCLAQHAFGRRQTLRELRCPETMLTLAASR